MKFRSHLKPLTVHGDFSPECNVRVTGVQKCTNKEWREMHRRPAYHHFKDLLQVLEAEQVPSETSLNYLLFCALWHVVNNSFVFKGVSRDLWKIAVRNSGTVSSWSKQPRLLLLQGHCGKCQGGAGLGGAGKGTGRRAASRANILQIPSWVVLFWVQTSQTLAMWPQRLSRILKKSFLFSDVKTDTLDSQLSDSPKNVRLSGAVSPATGPLSQPWHSSGQV